MASLRAERLISVRRQTAGNTCREVVAVHRSTCIRRRDKRVSVQLGIGKRPLHAWQQASGSSRRPSRAVIALPSRLLDLKPSAPRGNDQAKPCATKKREQTRSIRHGYENDALCTRIMLSVHACSAHVMTKFMHLELIPVAKCKN